MCRNTSVNSSRLRIKPPSWMQDQQARSIEIDKNLANLRANVVALWSASVSSVETKKSQFRLVSAKNCRIREFQFEQTALSEPLSRRECWHFPASWENTKAFSLTCTESARRMVRCCSRQVPLWSDRTKTLSKHVARILSLVWRTPTRSSARKAATMPPSCVFSNLMLRVNSSLQHFRAKDFGILRTTRWPSANLPMFSFVWPEPMMSDRWVRFCSLSLECVK